MLTKLFWGSSVVCLVVFQTLCQVPGSFAAINCTDNDGQYFPDPNNIHSFYWCNGGKPINYTCPTGKIYDIAKKYCVEKPTVSTTTNATVTNATVTNTTVTNTTVTNTTVINTTVTTRTVPTPSEPPGKPSTPVSTTTNATVTNATVTTRTVPTPSEPPGKPSTPARGHSKFNCSRKNLLSMIRCFKTWKRHLNGDPKDILQSAVNNTDEIFAAFEQERNSSGWFNPFEVLNILDDVGRQVATKSNQTITASNNEMLIKVSPVIPPYRFPDYSRDVPRSGAWEDVSDVIELPKGMFTSSNGYYVVSALYLDLMDKLPINVYETNNSHVINSHVISSLVIPEVTPPFNSNVIITMKHLKELSRDKYSVCAYWDFTIPTPKGNGSWSRRGCFVISERSNSTHTTCSCNHLTSFAILMGSESIPITKAHEFALSVITYIGCALSLFGSVAAIAVLVVLTKGLHSDRNIIHANLLISIAISQTVFLAGIEQTHDRTRCKLTAIMLHYFYLVSFAWMLCEGFHLYAMVIKVFNVTSRVYHYVAFSWGTPAVIVLITALSRFKEYGTSTSCWISGEYFTLLAFILPVALILLVNIVILSLVMKEICLLHVSESSHIRRMINSTFKTVIVLFPLLGITWVFGLLVFATTNIVFQYLFATLNTLQGFFIFVLHCLFNSEIRNNFKRKKEVWKSLRVFEDFRRRVAVSIIPVRIPVTKGTTSSNERAETFEKSSEQL